MKNLPTEERDDATLITVLHCFLLSLLLETVIKAYDFITWDMQIILATSDHDK